MVAPYGCSYTYRWSPSLSKRLFAVTKCCACIMIMLCDKLAGAPVNLLLPAFGGRFDLLCWMSEALRLSVTHVCCNSTCQSLAECISTNALYR